MKIQTMFVALSVSLTVQAWAAPAKPIDQIPRLKSTVLHILEAAKNQDRNGQQVITLKEQQGILRVIHRDQLSALEVLQIQSGIEKLPSFETLSFDEQVDVLNLIRDLAWVRTKLAQYEMFNGYHCRYSLAENPQTELTETSFAKNPSQYRGIVADEAIQRMEDNKTDRLVVGFCWAKAENDPLKIWTHELRKRQFIP